MSHLTYFPTGTRARWNKRMIESIKTMPKTSFLESVEVTNKVTGKKEIKDVKVPFSKGRIRKFVKSILNVSDSDKAERRPRVTITENTEEV